MKVMPMFPNYMFLDTLTEIYFGYMRICAEYA